MASSRPAPAPATAPAGVGAEETGRLGFVFIPRVVDRQSHHHMFWPALIFSSPGALRRRLPSPRDMEMFDLELENHQMNQRGALRESKALHPMDGTMKVAFLLGNEIPPSGTRSFAVYSQDVKSIQNGEPISMKPHTSFAKKNRDYIRKMELYSKHDRFLQALEIAERYRAKRDMNLLVSSMNWPLSPNAHWRHVQQPTHHWPGHHVGTSSASRMNASGNSYAPSTSHNNIAASRADTIAGIQRRREYDIASQGDAIIDVDSSGAYNIPTPSRDGLFSQTSKSALRKVAVEGPSGASTSRNGGFVSGGCNSQGDACSNNGQEMADNEDMEEAQSPQRPKQIDFDAAATTSARDTSSSLPIGSSTNTSKFRRCSNGDKKHVRFDAATSSASTTRGESIYGADSAPTSTAAPAANVTPSHGPPVTDKTEASSSSSSAVRTSSRRATPSPVQGDCNTTSKPEEKNIQSNAPPISTDERYKRLRALIKPDMDWSIVLPTLKDHGWASKSGRGLVSYYYCCSKFAHESVSYMLKHAKRGDEYFCNDEELMAFCRDKLGWVGGGNDSGGRRRRQAGSSSDSEAKIKSEAGRPKRESTLKSAVAADAPSSSLVTRKKKANPAKTKETRSARVNESPDKVNSSGSKSDCSGSSDSSFGRVPLTSSAMRERSVLLKVDSGNDRAKARSNSGGAALKSKTAAATKTKRKTKSKKQPRAKKETKEIAVANEKTKSAATKGKKTGTKKEEKRIQEVARPLTADPSLTPPTSSPAESTGKSPNSDSGPETIITDQNAFSGILLPVFKFRYSKGFYCLPGIDPKSPKAVEGKDYFKRMTSLRRHLCAYGIPLTALVSSKGKAGSSSGDAARRSSRRDATNHVDIDSLMHKDDRRALERWVRYAVSRSLVLKTEVPDDIERFPPRSFMNGPWQLLQKLGYKFSSGSYKVPTAQGSVISFGRAEDLEVHLARFGLVEDTTALNAEELLKLELYIAACSNVDSFQRICPEEDFPQNPALPFSAPSPERKNGSDGDMSAKEIEEEEQDICAAPSPSSLKTVKAPGVEEGEDGGEQQSSTPKVPQVLVLNQLPHSTSSSALSENSFNPDCPNGIPEVGDDEGRNAVRALSLEEETGDDGLGQDDLMEDVVDDLAINQVEDAGYGEEAPLQEEKAASDPSLGQREQDEDESVGRKRGMSSDGPHTSGTEHSNTNKKLRKSSSPDRASSGVSSDQEMSPLTSAGDSKSDDVTVMGPLPDQQGTVLDKLRCCQSVLHSDHVDDMYRKSSRVENHANRITRFLNDAMNARSKEGCSTFEASSMYVCGGPGTGKTTTLNKCINKCKGKFPKARFIFRNAASCGHDGSSAATRILNDIKEEMQVAGPAGDNPNSVYAKIEKSLSSKQASPLVLVLDEIDMLLSYSNKSTDNASGGDLLIKSFLRWASDPKYAFILIGISNAVDNGYTERLQRLGKISHILVFKPYREEDLISIIEARVGTKIIAEPAIKMVSRKVAAGSGDARKALDMTAQAVRKCETDLSVEQHGKNGDDIAYPIVKLPHMMRSIREGLGMRHTDAIMSMPQAAKIVLCVAVALSTVSPAWKIIRMKDLKKYCAEASRHGLMERLNIDHLFDIVQMLSDSGLLLSGDGNDLRYAAYQMDVHEIPLMLGVQLDDVECALEKTLMNEPFYKNMVSYVKKHHR